MKNTKELAQKARFFMAQSGVNQTELAAKIGVKQSSLNSWLNHIGTSLKEPHARKLCEILGLDYAAEMYRQHTGGHVAINIGGDNTQTSEARPNAHTLAEIIAAIMSADLPDAEGVSQFPPHRNHAGLAERGGDAEDAEAGGS